MRAVRYVDLLLLDLSQHEPAENPHSGPLSLEIPSRIFSAARTKPVLYKRGREIKSLHKLVMSNAQ